MGETRVASVPLQAGEWVEVRSKDEILATLDGSGRLEQMPFMPEMLRYCGKRLQVSKRAHKTCDPAVGIGGRRMENAVHLQNLRCDGSAHDGCQAGCLLFWKDAWLKRVDAAPGQSGAAAGEPAVRKPVMAEGCTEQRLHEVLKSPPGPGETEPTYMCQNTQVKIATTHLPWWDLRQYVEDYTSRNVTAWALFSGLVYTVWRTLAEAGIGIGTAMRWVYDTFQRATGGSPYPLRKFQVPDGTRTPKELLDLQPGDIVRVKPYAEILKTLDSRYRNRGLYFDPDYVPFTERQFRVEKRIKSIIDERHGRMIEFKSDAIVLENVVCEGRFTNCRRFCPRAILPYWREIWLERVPDKDVTLPTGASQSTPPKPETTEPVPAAALNATTA